MLCPQCGSNQQRVIDGNRPSKTPEVTKRRRECISCGFRYNTIERVVEDGKGNDRSALSDG
jgi:transcriptional repressor NrdR